MLHPEQEHDKCISTSPAFLQPPKLNSGLDRGHSLTRHSKEWIQNKQQQKKKMVRKPILHHSKCNYKWIVNHSCGTSQTTHANRRFSKLIQVGDCRSKRRVFFFFFISWEMKRSQPAETVFNESMKKCASLTQHQAERHAISPAVLSHVGTELGWYKKAFWHQDYWTLEQLVMKGH